ncbi:MAG: Gfo/Idh/MocA family oxidoreductase [Cyanobacteria bacterium J06635_1]
MTKISLALFGIGRWGTHLLRNFLAHPQISVRAVVDPSETRLTEVAKRFKLDSHAALLTDWQSALKVEGLEAVAIATPAATHNTLITAALKANLHILAEKPLTLDHQSSAALCQLAQQQQRQLVVDHTYLFHPAVGAGRAVLGKLATLRYGYATRTHLGPVRQDVDALWDLAIHDIAMFNYWLGESPTQVQAEGLIWQQTKPIPPRFPQGLADTVWCRLRYPSRFQAHLHLSWANPDKQRRLCMVGDHGTLIFDEMHATRPLTLQTGYFKPTTGQFIPQDIATIALPVSPQESLRNLCNHFVECVQQNQVSAISSGATGTALVQILEALSESLNQGGRWISLIPE